jgi:hypothetical protein
MLLLSRFNFYFPGTPSNLLSFIPPPFHPHLRRAALLNLRKKPGKVYLDGPKV